MVPHESGSGVSGAGVSIFPTRRLDFKVSIWGECKKCSQKLSCVTDLSNFVGLTLDEVNSRADEILWKTHEHAHEVKVLL